MAKKTWTLNGFAGGLNTDADLSDVTSEGQGLDEVAELNNLFLDESGKVHGKRPYETADTSFSSVVQTSNDDNLLLHNNNLYNKTGVYKIGDDVVYSGLSDYQAIDVKVAGSGEFDESPESETVTPDLLFKPVRKTGLSNNWEDIILCLGKSSPYNSFGFGMICPLNDSDNTLTWPEKAVRSLRDDGNNGGNDNEWRHADAIIGDVNPFDINSDESATEMENHSETASYSTIANLWDHWIAATSDDTTLGADAGATLSNVIDLKGGEDEETDCTNFEFFQQWHSNHGAGDDTNNDRSFLGFSVGSHAYNNQTGEDEAGSFGVNLPSQFTGKDLVIDVKINNSSNLLNLNIVIDSHPNNSQFGTWGADSYCKQWTLSLQALIDAGCVTDYQRIRLPYGSASYNGDNFQESEVHTVAIVPRYSTNPDFDGAVNSWRVREVAFVPSLEENAGLTNRYFMLSQTRVNDKGIESIPYNIPADGGTPGTTAGEVIYIPTKTAKLTVYKPTIASVVGKGNIYIQECDEDGNVLTDMFLLAQWHETDGVKSSSNTTDTYTAWDTGSTPNFVTMTIEEMPQSSTFTLESGYPEGTEYVNATWKHAAVVGRTAYIGAVTQPIGGTEDTSKILKSAIGKPAGFPNLQYIDVEFGGDGITHMEGIGDRLFVFSSTQLVIINVAQDIEFVEAQFPNMGVTHPRQVCKIGEGLGVINGSGVYVFDGQQVQDVKQEKNRNVAINSNCAIAYNSKLKYLFVWGWNNDTNDVALFSFKTNSWIGILLDDITLPTSESIPGANGLTYYCVATTEYNLGSVDNDSGTNEATVLRTGKISMGDIARNKKFYKVYINVTNPNGYTLEWSTTDTSSWTTASSSMSTGTNEVALSGATGKYIMFRLTGASARTDFEMGELSIIYREKSVK